MPVQWLFFTASTYVWFQYIFNNTEKGICLQTFTVWLIFVYVEATVRIKELKNMPSNLDLCRPMAASCIGYPFVSLGFGVKKYLNYKIMLRRQKEMQKENELTFNTVNRLHEYERINESSLNNNVNLYQNSNNIEQANDQFANEQSDLAAAARNEQTQSIDEETEEERRISKQSIYSKLEEDEDEDSNCYKNGTSNIGLIIENLIRLMTTYLNIAIFGKCLNLINRFLNFKNSNDRTKQSFESSSSSSFNNNINDNNNINNSSSIQDNNSSFVNDSSSSSQDKIELDKETSVSNQSDQLNSSEPLRLDKLKKIKQENKNEIKKLRNELQAFKQSESEFKDKLSKMQGSRNEFKFQCNKLQHDNTVLQDKIQNYQNNKQQEKNTICELEKRLQEERTRRIQLDSKLNKYSKVVECGDQCKQKRLDYEDNLNRLNDEFRMKELKFFKSKDDSLQKETLLLAALNEMRERNAQLESNLREETKLKLELFSVLGETRRKLEINQLLLFQKSKEVNDLNTRLSELMNVMPNSSNSNNFDPYSSIFLPNHFINQTINQSVNNNENASSLNSNCSKQSPSSTANEHCNNLNSATSGVNNSSSKSSSN